MVQSYLLAIIFLMLVSVTYIYTQDKVIEAISPPLKTEACKASVLASALKLEKNILFFTATLWDAPFSANCPTNFVEINNNRIHQSISDETTTIDAGNREDQIKRLVYDEMARCWDQFGSFEARIDDVNFDGQDADLDEPLCITCTVIRTAPENGDDPFHEVRLKDVYKYGLTHIFRDQQTYAQFLTNGRGDLDELITTQQDITLKPDDRYYVVFTIARVSERIGTGEDEEPDIEDSNLPINKVGMIGCDIFDTEQDRLLDPEGFSKSDEIRRKTGCIYSQEQMSYGKIALGEVDEQLIGNYAHVYPMTVRFVPNEEIFAVEGNHAQCERLF